MFIEVKNAGQGDVIEGAMYTRDEEEKGCAFANVSSILYFF
jgi:hypothetical protein